VLILLRDELRAYDVRQSVRIMAMDDGYLYVMTAESNDMESRAWSGLGIYLSITPFLKNAPDYIIPTGYSCCPAVISDSS
jgi:hypothetical protein